MNRQQQGDRGEASARYWYEMDGWDVYIPTGHSPDADFIASKDRQLVRVQVKTSGCVSPYGRWSVTLCTRGGNQSWSGLSKRFAADRCDELFIVTVDGRRWRMPSSVPGGHGINVGGAKYAQYEVAPGTPLVTAPETEVSLPSRAPAG